MLSTPPPATPQFLQVWRGGSLLCLQENEVNIGRFVIYLLLLFQFGVTLHVFRGNPHRYYLFCYWNVTQEGKTCLIPQSLVFFWVPFCEACDPWLLLAWVWRSREGEVMLLTQVLPMQRSAPAGGTEPATRGRCIKLCLWGKQLKVDTTEPWWQQFIKKKKKASFVLSHIRAASSFPFLSLCLWFLSLSFFYWLGEGNSKTSSVYINSNHQVDDDDFYDKNLALFEVQNISATLSSGCICCFLIMYSLLWFYYTAQG